ncbi:aspartyl/asparaginyl beta-hydroxylase domain-containing protein [Sphingomonas sp. Leaf38]|uniref:aspartyl/asparaginyl beta-hydroxylase domain-containing protein n=1 Tax=Sphingomonas sp. Leaf38 TaxID=1736217 RepID=UPI0009EB875F|nr:aspartyl/asparaginyl beta-hydroxylase domain-containing protein [Sphingomonas sp. Leaf38]
MARCRSSLTAGGPSSGWVPGEALVFDDTTEHEANNGSLQPRVVLIGDAWHHGTITVDRWAFTILVSAVVPSSVGFRLTVLPGRGLALAARSLFGKWARGHLAMGATGVGKVLPRPGAGAGRRGGRS